VLDQHALDGILRQVRVQGLAAGLDKGGERLDERPIFLVLLVDDVLERSRLLGHLGLEAVGSLLPTHYLRVAVSEEMVQYLNQSVGFNNRVLPRQPSALDENGLLGRLEDDVLVGIAERQFVFDLALKFVLFVLGFPETVGEAEGVEQRAVHLERHLLGAADGVLGHEHPVELLAALGKQSLEGAADRHFVAGVLMFELAQGAVVVLNGLVRRLEIEFGHESVSGQFTTEWGLRCAEKSTPPPLLRKDGAPGGVVAHVKVKCRSLHCAARTRLRSG
jgi:hypothetical protein